MTARQASLWRIYAFSTIVSLGLIVFAGIETGLKGLFLVLALAVLEISLSFDNAVINAKILKRMSPAWQQVFLTVGILIAVFGVRVLLPVLLVAVAINKSFSSVVDLALNNPTEYGHQLELAHPMIASFGGMFLLLIALDYFFEKRKILWLTPIERPLQRVKDYFRPASVVIALVALLLASRAVHGEEVSTVITAGLAGMGVYLAIHTADRLLHRVGIEKNLSASGKATFRAGLIGFIYLEVIDASFSLDGVIGAFAITNQILLIAIGLGIGALYVRTITIHMLRRGILDQYKYLEHGAHYAILALGVIMLTSLKFEVPEIITGLIGLSIIITALAQSWAENRTSHAEPK